MDESAAEVGPGEPVPQAQSAVIAARAQRACDFFANWGFPEGTAEDWIEISDFPLTTFGLQASSTVLFVGAHWALYVLGDQGTLANIVILSVMTACVAISHGGILYMGPRATSKLWCKAAGVPLGASAYYLTQYPFFRDETCALAPILRMAGAAR
jgi:hypothetical protein